MTAAQWRSKIKQQCIDIGTYKQSYNSVIDALAKILEQRDAAMEQFRKDGSTLLYDKTSDRGSVNQTIHPLVQLIDKLNNTALSYWKELGLTPLSYKKMSSAINTGADERHSTLAAALRSIEGE